jgi:hypothetical protein
MNMTTVTKKAAYTLISDALNIALLQIRSDDRKVFIQQLVSSPSFVITDVEEDFNRLYARWKEQTKFCSFIGDPADTAYAEIISLGTAVIPYIITMLKREESHLFIALNRITGVNPVRKEHSGNVRKMAEDWIRWWEGEDHAESGSDNQPE